jgi:hypothetical protein
VKVNIIAPRSGAPEKLLANAELVGFIPQAPNIKMVDIAIWDGDKGPWVAFPGRQYQGNDGKKKTARFVRPVGEEWSDLNKLQEFIIAEWRKWDAARAEAGPEDEGDDDENPFA